MSTIADVVLPDGSTRKGWLWLDDTGGVVLGAVGRTQAALADPDFVIEQGATFNIAIRYIDDSRELVDLSSGYTATWRVKHTRGASAVLVELTESSGITLGGATSASSNLALTLSASATAALDFVRGFHELVLTKASGPSIRLFEGAIQLRKMATGAA